MKKTISFLVIEDDQLARLSLVQKLKDVGIVSEADNLARAKQLLEEGHYDVAWIDLDLENELEGLEIIPLAKSKGIYSVVLSGREEEECIEKAYELGCDDYLSKPFESEALNIVLRKYEAIGSLGKFKDFFAKQYITQDQALIDQLGILSDIVVSDRPVFIKGATGVGKTFLAKQIHSLIHKNDQGFVHFNCSEVPENLIESELFGYKKGAFSGADKDKKGLLEMADGGTLFLDEIATMPMLLQQKLLKAIDEKTFYPLGSEEAQKSDFRLISATCENLEEMVEEGKFRQDLYFRIEGFNLDIPPLKKRREDIPLLLKHFLSSGVRRVVIKGDVKDLLYHYDWPGNIRELHKVIDILKSRCHGVIKKEDLPEHISRVHIQASTSESNSQQVVSSEVETIFENGLLNNMQIEYIKHNGMKCFLDKVEEEAVTYIHESLGHKVRESLSILKMSSSSFYRVLNRLKKGGDDGK
ncbi:sigma-54 dependent transcriptional regulator [Bacteriovorax sp. DB6_IX]|uniref:sigma-54-dependent transcriptional regulator n=1 Tax=Bacteriovorax sp. DB6_IX TaxID=1353530 RepID=UPI00038A51E8|nr:sigma-54 dependent transcriptional regulator [Bacteriovorax sp. DB6_IX]EQC50988.1 sigma-54 interaction domain protein [Bacteriovorax sp. DB6_IX]